MNQQLPNHRRLPKVPGCCCHMRKAANICGTIELVLCALITISASYYLLLDFTYFIFSFLLTTGFVAITALCVACLFMGVKHWDCKSLLPYIVWKPIWLILVWTDIIRQTIIVWKTIEIEQQQTQQTQISHNWSTTDAFWENSNSYYAYYALLVLKRKLIVYTIYTLVGIICVYVVAHCYKYMKNNRRPIRQPSPAVCYTCPGVGDLGQVESLPPVPPYEAYLNYYPAQPTENLYGGVPADEK